MRRTFSVGSRLVSHCLALVATVSMKTPFVDIRTRENVTSNASTSITSVTRAIRPATLSGPSNGQRHCDFAVPFVILDAS